MPDELTVQDCDFILECLEYAHRAYQSTEYPFYAQRQRQLDRLASVQNKLRNIRRQQQFEK